MDTKVRQQILDNYPNYCAINAAASLIAGKWKVMILYHLLVVGTMRFSELKREVSGITQKMLTAQLRELEANGIITRTVYPVVPPKVEYACTELGMSLKPIISAMREWGDDYVQAVVSTKATS